MIRFLKELFNPKLKCHRLGHTLKTVGYTAYTDTQAHRCVVALSGINVEECTRCKRKEPGFVKVQEFETFNKASLPESYWESIRRKGYAIVD